MCGIAGVAAADPGRADPRTLREGVAIMLGQLAHRGPDGEGIEVRDGVALGHRRLAIIDLSPRARQPMALRCREEGPAAGVWLTFNGEIYNHAELRAGLAARGHRFHSDSDTEVLLHLYEERGEDCVAPVRGMFAFALWDAAANRLMLARDRLGKKPLYYLKREGELWFASEIKAIQAHARWHGQTLAPDPSALASYLALKYVPGPRTALAGVAKLPPASVLLYQNGRTQMRSYWALPAAASAPRGALEPLLDQLASTLREAVRLRLRSDVPLGLFLSGGLDSGILAALAARIVREGQAPDSVLRTFTVGFKEADYDEMAHAAGLAKTLGTRHETIPLSPDPSQTIELLPDLARQLDQPFADSSALAVSHLARAVRRHVTVALSGDGADELFLGYDRYRAHRLALLWQGLLGSGGVARAASRGAAAAVRLLPLSPPARRNLAGRAARFLGAASLPGRDRNDAWILCFDPTVAGSALAPEFLRAAGEAHDPLEALHRAYADPGSAGAEPVAIFQRADLLVYLPDDILHKLDAATMAHGLEARCPYLDHEVVEAALRLPVSASLSGGRGKDGLRRAFASLLPPATARRRKAGFGLPLDHWLRGGLAGHARDLLLEPRTLARGIVRAEGVSRLIEEHVTGAANREDVLWALIMLEHWFRSCVDAASARPAGRPLAEAGVR